MFLLTTLLLSTTLEIKFIASLAKNYIRFFNNLYFVLRLVYIVKTIKILLIEALTPFLRRNGW